MKINKPANEVFEAFVDPAKIGNYWFSSSSERWEKGKKILLRYDEYGAEGFINIIELQENKQINFSWGEQNDETVVTITLDVLDENSTIVKVSESGFKAEDPDIVTKMLGQKEGWIYMLSCLKSYLEHDIKDLRASLVH
ncbi:SRPBCC family protein [Paucisalibacillus globulus]|uniref:SRPBCC family protein n=1 Tax=Paucisalibacillus globulus TaxID=351095 RepID=UPI001596E964|nr:SRPBCC family protein [Paucisalibacillus globulus]